jgi:2,3-bisphosphoglycerate-dependent phosphoglycerate mutase
MTFKLILLRHGESEWNSKNLFTGWVDVDLNEKGVAEAKHAAELLKAEGLLPDKLHTSVLRRAIHTANLALDGCERHWIPVERSWRLNERHYGGLQGLNKTEIRERFGEDQFMTWRRSYDVPPPLMETDGAYSQFSDARYAMLPPGARPATECLADVVARLLPYWYDRIIPDLRAGKTVLITAHGNSLRALVKHLDQIPDAEISELNIPTGIPLYYELDDDMSPVTRGGRYLDPDAAAASIEAVKNQGKK